MLIYFTLNFKDSTERERDCVCTRIDKYTHKYNPK